MDLLISHPFHHRFKMFVEMIQFGCGGGRFFVHRHAGLDTTLVGIIQWVDVGLMAVMWLVTHILPDFGQFNT